MEITELNSSSLKQTKTKQKKQQKRDEGKTRYFKCIMVQR